MMITAEAAEGKECVSCGKPGAAEDNVVVGTADEIAVWACPGGCVVIAGMSR